MQNTKNSIKIVCTLGPASWSKSVLTKMIANGMTVARVNGAFAEVKELEKVTKLVRSISSDIALMLDIKGHELRLNKFEEDLFVKVGDELIIGSSESDNFYVATYPQIYKHVSKDQIILIDKGEVRLKVTKVSKKTKKIYTKVINGGVIKGGKGMNIPGAVLSNPCVTERDIEQIKYCVQENWDFISASFIRNKDDIYTVKKYTKNSDIRIIAKIEDNQGVQNFDEILEVSDGIMIARGDMGAEIPFEKLPIIQKEIIYKCNMASKPVITATNMLESMISKPMPTRAEITDVANAVLDGTDAVMTSGETTAGKYPAETVATMSKIAEENVKYLQTEILESFQLEHHKLGVAMTNASIEVCKELDITKIIVVSNTGTSARLLARHNPHIPILAFVSKEIYKRQLGLTKGVEAILFPGYYKDRDKALEAIIKYAFSNKHVTKSDNVLFLGRGSETLLDKVYFPNIFEYVNIGDYLEKY